MTAGASILPLADFSPVTAGASSPPGGAAPGTARCTAAANAALTRAKQPVPDESTG